MWSECMQYSVWKGAGCVYIILDKFPKTGSFKPPQYFHSFPPSAFSVLQFCKLCGGTNTFCSEVPDFCDDTSLGNGHSHFCMWIIIQWDATLYSLFMSVNSSTCFEWYPHPSSGAHVTVSTPSGICKTVTATCHERPVIFTTGCCHERPVMFTTGCSYGLTNARWCWYTDMSSWWWVGIPPKTCRAVYRHK
jgi:hypothetical protein